MELLSIKIKIADRIYPMRVQQEDEAFVRQASNLVAEKMSGYQQALKIQDKQDLLAMVAFDCLVEHLKTQQNRLRDNDFVVEKINGWKKSIEDVLHHAESIKNNGVMRRKKLDK